MAKRRNQKLKRNALWKFTVHAESDKGPNRVTYDPDVALEYLIKLEKQLYPDPLVKVEHLPTGLVARVLDVGSLEEMMGLVFFVGVTTEDKRLFKLYR